MLTERVMKARTNGICALCRAPTRLGQYIGKIPRRGWAHLACIVDRKDPWPAPAATETPDPQQPAATAGRTRPNGNGA